MSLARHLLVVPLAIPLSAALSPSRLESEAGMLGQRLGAAVAALHAACAAPAGASLPPPVEGDVITTLPESATPLAAPSGSRKRGAHPRKGAPSGSAIAGGIFVGKDTVLRLASAGVVPTGLPVGATAAHPAGILLSGVGALGIGLSDGDILTEVEGREVSSEAQVVGIVIGARSRHAEQISAVVWRAAHAHPHEHPDAHTGERWSLVVAMPYL